MRRTLAVVLVLVAALHSGRSIFTVPGGAAASSAMARIA
jgi:hypothetical protein